MTFHQRYYRSPLTHQGVVLERLHRERVTDSRRAKTFEEVCDMTSIPRDLRPALLRSLVGQGYVTATGTGQVHLTALGAATATASRT